MSCLVLCLAINSIATATVSQVTQSAFREAEQLASLMLNYEANTWGWNLSAIHQSERNVLLPNNQQRTLDSFWDANSKFRYRINNVTI